MKTDKQHGRTDCIHQAHGYFWWEGELVVFTLSNKNQTSGSSGRALLLDLSENHKGVLSYWSTEAYIYFDIFLHVSNIMMKPCFRKSRKHTPLR